MLINLWYVAEWSNTLKDEPVRVKMLGQNFVLFRDDEGVAHCLSDVCIHRGGSLSGGRCIDGNVACPYHGWQFSGEGQVMYIPSEGRDFKIPDRARIDAYPTEERYGMIWVFLGDLPEEERPSIPPFPEYTDPNWKAITDEWVWKAEAARVIENGIDLAHASFVHPMFGYPETAGENEILKVEKDDMSAMSWNIQYPPQLKGELGLRRFIRKDRQPTETIPGYHMSGYVVRIQINLNAKMQLLMFDCNTPVDEHTTKTFATQLRTFFKQDMFDKGSRKRLRKVFREDAEIIERAAPNYLPENLANELSVQDDRFMSTFRAARRRLIEKGWQIDSYTVKQYEGRKAFAIPSPMRRSNPELKWVMEEVPLVQPAASLAIGEREALS